MEKNERNDIARKQENANRIQTKIYKEAYTEESLKYASPFTSYFDSLISKIRISISCVDPNHDVQTLEDNPYYYPRLLRYHYR